MLLNNSTVQWMHYFSLVFIHVKERFIVYCQWFSEAQLTWKLLSDLYCSMQWIHVTNLNLLRNLLWEIFGPHMKFPIACITFEITGFCPIICQTVVNVTAQQWSKSFPHSLSIKKCLIAECHDWPIRINSRALCNK